MLWAKSVPSKTLFAAPEIPDHLGELQNEK
jgi:hypothetical protein